MRKTFHSQLAATLLVLTLVWPACAEAADLDTACYTIPLPASWSAVPDSIELNTAIDGMAIHVSCVRLKGSPEPKEERDELTREMLDNEFQYQTHYEVGHDMKALQPLKRRKLGRFDALMFSVFERPDHSRFLRYCHLRERAAVVAEISYLPAQQDVVDRFLREGLGRIGWKPHTDWDAAY